MRITDADHLRQFSDWLSNHGAEVLDPIFPGEILRVIIKGITLSATQSSTSRQTWPAEIMDLYSAFMRGGISPRLAANPQEATRMASADRQARIRTLARRDGWSCWYCNHKLRPSWHRTPSDVREATIEEVCPRQIGGPVHIGNQVLTCRPCNTLAANLPVVKKVELREAIRTAQSTEPRQPRHGSVDVAEAGEANAIATLAKAEV